MECILFKAKNGIYTVECIKCILFEAYRSERVMMLKWHV